MGGSFSSIGWVIPYESDGLDDQTFADLSFHFSSDGSLRTSQRTKYPMSWAHSAK